ncbi:DNA cytosine methyltransferase [Mesomycoplasma ovipneumoniae]|uniref:DNA cytosine methyltransferase n=1 Tax=Mesomycoplasma ovipneumoniae TaxID=29562 RepID=UPI0026E33393|nr:DNA cytosine methyltransferase [Mesomycoplasma ovipneumoniae]MDO6826272.1 DNA cytosine methyltransferase [Mesomycoplasma ovipneumoniae]MDO6857292.1 DNA cytosine methyltransferase [Mesomycoplasma ovipneumoniae]
MINNKLTYISLFSSAGVGCYGFKVEDFECIATNELIERRLNIQKINNKCSFNSGYISGDITNKDIQNKIYNEVKLWNKMGNDRVDVVVATPPCQGMSVANHKKKDDEIERNSLIVESVKIVKKVLPRFFVFENVAAFWKTGCTYNSEVVSIGNMITSELSSEYIIENRILNFKNYGSNSSRTRTLVIGVHKSESDFILPLELFPSYREEKTLREVIGSMPELSWGEYDNTDFYHSFREYPIHMRDWISNLKEGQSAFDNIDDVKKPHKIINGEIVINKFKNGDKYKRQIFDKVAPCFHTRNDQMASQNTIHPNQDRVFSIRELMKMMSIPDSFKWSELSLDDLNSKSYEEKKALSKKEEMNIRQSIGEAVPTEVFRQIANNIKKHLRQKKIREVDINKIIDEEKLADISNLKKYVLNNKDSVCFESLARIIELSNAKRYSHSAFYTPKKILNEIASVLPDFEKDEIHILEPSVGIGSFIPLIFKKYDYIKKVSLTVIDIDPEMLDILKVLFDSKSIPENFNINFINADYMDTKFNFKFDLIIGNPPFTKLSSKDILKYIKNSVFSKNLTNLAGLFLEKSLLDSHNVSLILPKNLLSNLEYIETRNILKEYNVESILDFGELGFKGVLIETINLTINNKKNSKILVKSLTKNVEIMQPKKYIFSDDLPYWVIYRNDFFDKVSNKLIFDVFSVFRDRQITSKMLNNSYNGDSIRVIKSRNISDDGSQIVNIEDYDSYMDLYKAKKLSVYKFIDSDVVYLAPNLTYKPRLLRKEKGYITNGSVAILQKKYDFEISEKQRLYISSQEFREFYSLARNYQTRSLNIDNTSVYWFGINKEV